MRVEEARIPLRDNGWLAATLYLPDEDAGPQPCLVEALPYRKDDLTSSYAESYRSLCEDHGYAVCRIDVRGTGSSPGDALDEWRRAWSNWPRLQPLQRRRREAAYAGELSASR